MHTAASDRHLTVRVIIAATCAATLAMVPVFMLGATAPFVRADLGFGPTALGMAVSVFWVTMALTGAVGGQVAQALGATAVVRLGGVTTSVALLAVSQTGSWLVLILGMAMAGVGSALTMPATDLALTRWVPDRELGVAFGIKQSSLPAASLLAGLGVPVLAVSVGWRWAFAAAVLLAVPALALVPPLSRPDVRPGSQVPARGSSGTRTRLVGVRGLAVGMGLAMAAVSSTGAFYVESALDHGVDARMAGVLLAIGSAGGVLGRFLFSWRLSGSSRPFTVAAALTGAGGLGTSAIAVSTNGMTLLLATLVAFSAGWGWNGLFTHAVVRAHPYAAARASGILVVGAASGGALGPALFGIVAAQFGFDAGWSLASAEFFAASALWLLVTRRRCSSSAA